MHHDLSTKFHYSVQFDTDSRFSLLETIKQFNTNELGNFVDIELEIKLGSSVHDWK